MAKKIVAIVKMTLTGGTANPGPPLGPALAQYGINLMDFVSQYNEQTQDKRGETIPAVITIYEDKSFTFELKTPPASALLLKALGKEKGSGEPHKSKIGKLSRVQLEKIAEEKMADLNAHSTDDAIKILTGTARSMGIDITNE